MILLFSLTFCIKLSFYDNFNSISLFEKELELKLSSMISSFYFFGLPCMKDKNQEGGLLVA